MLLPAAYHYPKGSPWNQGELSAKLTEGFPIPPPRLRRATSLLKKGSLTGGFWAVLLHTVAPLSKRLPFPKGGARSARAVREAARSKPSKARSVASEPCERREATMPHCGMLSAEPTEGLSLLIVPGGVYGGGGAIFASENPIFQSKNRFLAVSAPGNP